MAVGVGHQCKRLRMASEEYFQVNIERFARLQPQLAYQLDCVNVAHFDPFVGQNGLPNLLHLVDSHTLHEADPQVEARAWFASLELSSTQILHVFGVGLGYYYQAVRAWLKKSSKRRLIFLEDDPAVIYFLFHTELGADILKDEQVELRYFRAVQLDPAFWGTLTWDCLLKPFQISALRSYEQHRGAIYANLKAHLAYEQHARNELVDEYLDHGIAYYLNFYSNLLQLHQSHHGNALFEQFKGVPAIICGAGPSLAKVLPQLHQLRGKALIIAGGSAINALNASGLDPHLAAGIDPNSAQYQRLSTASSFETPYFYRGRMHHQAFRLIHGPRLYVNGGGGYDTPEWFEQQLGIPGDIIDEGHNVVNFCTSLACELGCNPLIFVGLDLAYTDMQAYAPGVVSDAEMDEEKIRQNPGVDSEAVVRLDIHGKPVVTLWKWIMESEWTGTFAAEHPHIQLINATDGGLGCPGIPNIPLQEVAQEHLKRELDLQKILWEAIQSAAMPQVTKRRVRSSIKKMQESLVRCVKHCRTLLREIRIQAREGRSSPQMALTEAELEHEVAYKYVLSIFNEIFSRTQNAEKCQINRLNEGERMSKLAELEAKRIAFLKKTAEVNLQIIEVDLNAYQPIE